MNESALPNSPFSLDVVRDFFDSHWTVRRYKKVAMPPEHLDLILHAAQRAPTDATAQMYSFIRLTDPDLREKVAALSGNPHIAEASESFLICGDVHRLAESLHLGGFEIGEIPHIAVHFAIGDAVLAGQSMLIAAEMIGYRGCWIGGVLNALAEISALTKLPRGVFPFAGLTIGVADEPAQNRPRLPRKQVVFDNHYQTPSAADLQQGIADMASITGRGNWIATLARYFAKDGTMELRDRSLGEYLRSQLDLSPRRNQR
jgi:FMN reductase (NADPH)